MATTLQNSPFSQPAISESDSSTAEMKKEFARTLLSVLGKNIALKAEHKDEKKSFAEKAVKNQHYHHSDRYRS